MKSNRGKRKFFVRFDCMVVVPKKVVANGAGGALFSKRDNGENGWVTNCRNVSSSFLFLFC
jgi:photosystem II stability/assembly factor-like uncharacterized protein